MVFKNNKCAFFSQNQKKKQTTTADKYSYCNRIVFTINNKKSFMFIKFDIEKIYSSISESMILKPIDFA